MAIATGTALLAAGALGAGASAYSANKAAQAQKEAAKASQVDINALDAQTREIARRNALESMALEKELTPEVAALRQQSIQGLLGGMGTTQREQNIADLLYGGLGTQVGQAPSRSDIGSPLLRAAISRAQADLARGGKLDADVQDAVTRASLAKAGRISGGGLGLGRDITARDLGLTSMDVAQQRLQRASQLGGQELGMSQARAQMGLAEQEAGNQLALANASNLLNKLQLLQQVQTAGYGRTLSAAGLGQSIAPPVVGLDPGAIASAVTGNAANLSAAKSNLANIYGAQGQSMMQFGGQAIGAGILAAANKKPGTQYPAGSNAAFYGL
jgi:hypothetical protein